jgi:hypothetical protein
MRPVISAVRMSVCEQRFLGTPSSQRRACWRSLVPERNTISRTALRPAAQRSYEQPCVPLAAVRIADHFTGSIVDPGLFSLAPVTMMLKASGSHRGNPCAGLEAVLPVPVRSFSSWILPKVNVSEYSISSYKGCGNSDPGGHLR